MEPQHGGLPPELIIHIAAYSSPSSIVVLEQLCKGWNELIRKADSICWRHHALSYTASDAAFASSISISRGGGGGVDGDGGGGGVIQLADYVKLVQGRCLNEKYWDETKSWKDACRRQKALQDNWSAASVPRTRTDVLGFCKVDPSRSALPVPKLRSLTSSRQLSIPYASQDSSYVWRARLDTATDAKFVLTTWHTGGLRVVDARPEGSSSVLWELPRWSVRPYAHLEYKRGIACWDGEQGIEVWKRWKLVLGKQGEDEPANKRGVLVKVATLPDVANTRGFMLNDDLHLTICSSDGKSVTYDLASSVPQLLYSYDLAMTPQHGPAGHLEHDSDIAVYSMGQKGYTVYHKSSATLLGNIDLSVQSSTLYTTLEECKETNFFAIDSKGRYPDLVSGESCHDRAESLRSQSGHRSAKDFVTVDLERGGLGERGPHGEQAPSDVHDYILRTMGGERPASNGKRTNAIALHCDLWGAAMIRKLADGATILVARSRGGRVLICSDLLGLLAAQREGGEEEARIKIRESVALIECGGRATRTEFYTGGWLTVHNGRAAWEIDDLVYVCQVPSRTNTLPLVGTPVWMLPSLYKDEVPMPDMQIPISFMSLDADDVLLTTYLHPAYIFITDRIHSRWETTILKSVRIIHFSPPPANGGDERDEDEEDNAVHPITNANKREHQRWATTGRRLARAAEDALAAEEMAEQGEWTDEEQQEDNAMFE